MSKEIPDIFPVHLAIILIVIWIGISSYWAGLISGEAGVAGGDTSYVRDNAYVKNNTDLVDIPPFPSLAEIENHILLGKIIDCESGWTDDCCNKEFGCDGGQGLCQIIPNTFSKAINSLDEMGILEQYGIKKEDANALNPVHNYIAGYYLLITRGTAPWGNEDTWWGSHACWSIK